MELTRASGAEFVIQDFTNVPVETCIKQDALRLETHRVGEKVIRAMANKYHLDNTVSNAAGFDYDRFKPVGQQDHMLPHRIIVDLDGTLALMGTRSPFDATHCDEDEPNIPVVTLVKAMYQAKVRPIFVSGREEKYREPTNAFLMKYLPVESWGEQLHMRATGDFRKDWIIKGEIFDKHIREQYFIVFALDDRDQVVNFWRHIGLTCFQVAKGDF
jgi:hypothetical protein